MNLKLKRWQVIAFIVILLLAILNPSYSDFKEYEGSKYVHRELNGILFSIYVCREDDSYYNRNARYLGILKNFIRLNPSHESTAKVTDSASTVTVLDSPSNDSVQSVLATYYNYLRKAGADVAPTLYSFKKTLDSDSIARKYYDYLRKNNFDVPSTYESFKRTLGLRGS